MDSARVLGLDHVNVEGPMELLERCVAFYTTVLGMRVGPRPPFRRRGFWLYAGDAPIVHLSERATAPAESAGALHHVALRCGDIETTRRSLREHAIPFETVHVPATGQVQLFLQDPAGVRLELNFPE